MKIVQIYKLSNTYIIIATHGKFNPIWDEGVSNTPLRKNVNKSF